MASNTIYLTEIRFSVPEKHGGRNESVNGIQEQGARL
jgi:hypothetical protein